MDNKMLMENYLLVLKSTVEVFVHGTLESSNQAVRNLLKKCLNEIMTLQANTYDEMTKYGWYQVLNVPGKTINDTITKLEKGN